MHSLKRTLKLSTCDASQLHAVYVATKAACDLSSFYWQMTPETTALAYYPIIKTVLVSGTKCHHQFLGEVKNKRDCQ
jgi:hypothetical protein